MLNVAIQDVEDLKQQNQVLIKTSRIMREQYDKAIHRCETLEYEIDEFRNLIVNLRHTSLFSPDNNTHHEERIYVLHFNEINTEIDFWVIKEHRCKNVVSLAQDEQEEIISVLSLFGEHGLHYSEQLYFDRIMFTGHRHFRIALIHHCFGVFLYNKVFEKTTFRYSRNTCDHLNHFEGELYSQRCFSINAIANLLDKDFGTISMMRRAINLAGSESRRHSFDEDTFAELSTIVHILLPESSAGRIEMFVRKILTKAISLRDAMSREEAM